MKIEFVCKNYNASEYLKNILTKKLEKLDKYFDGDNVSFRVSLRENASMKPTMEITVNDGGQFVRAEMTGDSQFDNIDAILPKLEKQIIRYSSKKGGKKKVEEPSYVYTSGFDQDSAAPVIVKRKSLDLNPMTEADAVEWFELLDHDFFLFFNVDTGFVNVLYKRKDGDCGLISLNY